MSKIELSPEALEARRAYQREYYKQHYKRNPEKYKQRTARYWERKAAELRANTEETDAGKTDMGR